MTPEREERIKKVALARQLNLGIILENVDDPHNVSAVLRSADSVGVQHVYVLKYGHKKNYHFKSKPSGSAHKWLNIWNFENLEDCFAKVRENHQQIFATHLNSDSKSIYKTNLSGSVAIAFGNEHAGLTEEALAKCDGNIEIPQYGMVKSLNISVACAVTLYEALRQREQKELYLNKRSEATDQLFQEWLNRH